AELETAAAGLRHAPPRIGFVSNLTGDFAAPSTIGASYWRRHAREPVKFADGVRRLYDRGCRVFVEIGPGSTLLGMARQAIGGGDDAAWLPSLRQGRGDWAQML